MSVCVRVCECGGRAQPQLRAEPASPARRAAEQPGSSKLRRGPRSRTHKLRCGPGGEGRVRILSPAEQKQRCVCWSPARQAPGPPHHLPLPRSQSFCPQSVCCSTCLCAPAAAVQRREGEGLKTTGACSPVAALPALAGVRCPGRGHGCSASRQGRRAPAAWGGRLSPAGSRDLPWGWGRGRAGAPGWPRSCRELRLRSGLSSPLPSPKLGCKSGRRLCSAGTSRLAPEGHGLCLRSCNSVTNFCTSFSTPLRESPQSGIIEDFFLSADQT